VAYFAATFLGQQMKLRILCEKLLIVSQRFFGIPPFRFYALADGIRRILSTGTFSPPPEPPASLQLELTLGDRNEITCAKAQRRLGCSV